MNATDQREFPNANQSEGTFSRHGTNQNEISDISGGRSDFDGLSQTAIIADQREKIQKLQLKSANYRQKEIKLKRDKDYLKKQVQKMEINIEKLEEHREQDAENLLFQEETLSALKGRYRTSENPNEIAKALNSIKKLTKEESKLLKEVKNTLENTTKNYQELAEIVPEVYEKLRKLKFYGDTQMNEILLRQIHIYVEQHVDKSKEFSKHKITNFEDNKNLRKKLREKYEEHEQLKADTIEDYKQKCILQRKLNFYETDFMIEREKLEKQSK